MDNYNDYVNDYMNSYNCPDCNDAKLQSDKNARKINEVIEQVNQIIDNDIATTEYLLQKADEIAEVKVNEVLGDLRTEIDTIESSLDNKANLNETTKNINSLQNRIDNLVIPMLPENVNLEVTDAHNSRYKGITFDNLKQRLDYIDLENTSLSDILINDITFKNGQYNEGLYYSDTDKWLTTNLLRVNEGDIIHFTNKANFKWKFTTFNNETISPESLIYNYSFGDFTNLSVFIVDNITKALTITVGYNNDNAINPSDFNQIKLFKRTNKITDKINKLENFNNEIIISKKENNPYISRRSLEDDCTYHHNDIRLASDIFPVSVGSVIKFNSIDKFGWKLAFFSENLLEVENVISMNSYNYFKDISTYEVIDKNIKGVVIQVKKLDNSTITDEEVIEFGNSLTITNIKIKEELLSNVSNDPISINVTSWNIAHFGDGKTSEPSGTDENIIKYRNIIGDIKPNILLACEDDPNYNYELTSNEAVYSIFKYKNTGSKRGYVCNSVYSDFKLSSKNEINFTNKYSDRYFNHCVCNIGSKEINLISTHLDFYDITLRQNQILQIIEYCKDMKYVIIGGDMNPSCRIEGNFPNGEEELNYIQDYKLWVDNGYNIANCGYFGVLGTETRDFPYDNIIVSNNIHIKNVKVTNDELSDHKPISASLLIY